MLPVGVVGAWSYGFIKHRVLFLLLLMHLAQIEVEGVALLVNVGAVLGCGPGLIYGLVGAIVKHLVGSGLVQIPIHLV